MMDDEAAELERLRQQWRRIEEQAPSGSLSGRKIPTKEEIDQLRAHKARVKAFLAPLSSEKRALFSKKKKSKSTAPALSLSSSSSSSGPSYKRKMNDDSGASLQAKATRQMNDEGGDKDVTSLSFPSNETKKEVTARNPVAEELALRLSTKPVYLTHDGLSWIFLVKHWMPSSSISTSTTARRDANAPFTDDDDDNSDKYTFASQWALHPAVFQPLRLFGKTFYEKRWSQAWGFNYSYSGTISNARELRKDDEDSAMVRMLIDRANELVSGIDFSQTNTRKKNNNKILSGDDDDSCQKPSSSSSVVILTHPYNGCLQNWYEPDQTIGLHSDDEKDLRLGYPIFSLSWGGTRRFVFKARADSPSSCVDKKFEVYLEDGDLLVMGGTCQRTHKHEVPKPRVTLDPPTSNRINWTIRAFRN